VWNFKRDYEWVLEDIFNDEFDLARLDFNGNLMNILMSWIQCLGMFELITR
jgi:hypothetical protein